MNQFGNTPSADSGAWIKNKTHPKPNQTRPQDKYTHAATGGKHGYSDYTDTQIVRYSDTQLLGYKWHHTRILTKWHGILTAAAAEHRLGMSILATRTAMSRRMSCGDGGGLGSSGWGRQLAQCLAMAMSFWPGNAENLTNDVRSGRDQAVGVPAKWRTEWEKDTRKRKRAERLQCSWQESRPLDGCLMWNRRDRDNETVVH